MDDNIKKRRSPPALPKTEKERPDKVRNVIKNIKEVKEVKEVKEAQSPAEKALPASLGRDASNEPPLETWLKAGEQCV